MLTPQERKIVEYGRSQGKTREQVLAALASYRASVDQGSQSRPTVRSTVAGFGEDLAKRAGNVVDAGERFVKGEQSLRSTALQAAGQVAGFYSDAGGRVVSAAMPDVVREPLARATERVVQSAPARAGAEMYGRFKEANPVAAANVEAAANIAGFVPVPTGAAAAARAAMSVGRGTGKVASRAASAVAPVVRGTADAAKLAAEGAARIPGRIATNVAEKAATREAILELPGELAQRAARDGIDVPDVQTLVRTVPRNKASVSNLIRVVRDFADGKSKVNPLEVVGKPIVARLRVVESSASKVGAQLSDAARKIGVVTKDELAPVFERLKSVPGLEGLRVTPDGKLNFRDTVLTTVQTAADRKAIQEIFTQATRWGKGPGKHRLRQELFEILNGKKRSLTNLTKTQEQAYEAMRKGLADVLDAKDFSYKKLNQAYARARQPVDDLRKALRVDGDDGDLLDLSAGLLAKRLTSNAASNPQIRSILRRLDEATKTPGTTLENIEDLQDIFNVLDRYYDIAAKTGFKGQIESSLRSSGVRDAITSAVADVARQTPAVRRKALEALLDSLLQ